MNVTTAEWVQYRTRVDRERQRNAVANIFHKVEREAFRQGKLHTDPYTYPASKRGMFPRKIGLNNLLVVPVVLRAIQQEMTHRGIPERYLGLTHVETTEHKVTVAIVYRKKTRVDFSIDSPIHDRPVWIPGYEGSGVWREFTLDAAVLTNITQKLRDIPPLS